MSKLGQTLVVVLAVNLAGCADLVAPTRDSRAPEVVYHYTDRGSGFGDPVPLEFRYSNSFRLSQAR